MLGVVECHLVLARLFSAFVCSICYLAPRHYSISEQRRLGMPVLGLEMLPPNKRLHLTPLRGHKIGPFLIADFGYNAVAIWSRRR